MSGRSSRAIDGLSGWSVAARRSFLALAVGLILAWTGIVVLAGGYLAAAVPFYRALSVCLIIATVPILLATLGSILRRQPAGLVVALLALAVCLKCAHWSYYVSEWNYRQSQGPWGRAIGQWVPPGWPIYTTHTWPADLAFATGHPVRQLPSERHLAYVPGKIRFVLLLGSEFENWPEHAPSIEKVAEMLDERGSPRVLARTPGDLPWTQAARARIQEARSSDADN